LARRQHPDLYLCLDRPCCIVFQPDGPKDENSNAPVIRTRWEARELPGLYYLPGAENLHYYTPLKLVSMEMLQLHGWAMVSTEAEK
jgi:hypothetical protein